MAAKMLAFEAEAREAIRTGVTKLARAVKSTLGPRGRNAVLLANHGSLACGRDIKAAVKVAEVTEKMARVYWGVLQAGEPHEIPVQKHKMFLDKFERNFSTE